MKSACSIICLIISLMSSACMGSVKKPVVKSIVAPVVIQKVCYLNLGKYYSIGKLKSASNCRNMDKIPQTSIQEISFVSGEMKCGLFSIQLNSGALLILKVKVDVVIGMLVITDGKCQIEYSILILPKVDKR